MTASRRPSPGWPFGVRLLSGGCALGAALVVVGNLPPAWRPWFALAVAVTVLPGVLRRELAVLEPLTFGLVIAGATVGALAGDFSVPQGVLVGLLLLAFGLLVELADDLAGAVGTRGAEIVGWLGTVAPLLGAGGLAGLLVGAVLILPLPPVLAVVLVSPLLVLAAAALAFGQRFVRG
jgi:hypothetical protein